MIRFPNAVSGHNFVRTKPKKTNVMKTIAKTLVAISILMISLNVIAGTNPLSNGQVHYKVQIHLQKDVPFHTTNVYIVMLDGKDRPIAPAQRIVYGKLSYDFYELQSVIGTRKAILVFDDGSTTRLFNAKPDVQNGKFILGGTYDFNLYITAFQRLGISEE